MMYEEPLGLKLILTGLVPFIACFLAFMWLKDGSKAQKRAGQIVQGLGITLLLALAVVLLEITWG